MHCVSLSSDVHKHLEILTFVYTWKKTLQKFAGRDGRRQFGQVLWREASKPNKFISFNSLSLSPSACLSLCHFWRFYRAFVAWGCPLKCCNLTLAHSACGLLLSFQPSRLYGRTHTHAHAHAHAHAHTHTHARTHACTFTVYMPTRTHSGTWQVAFPFLTFSLYNILATAGLCVLVVCMCSDTSAVVLIWAKWLWIDDKFLFMFLLPITDLSVRFWWKIIHDIMG